jgi:hypothetical protein
MKNEPLRYSTYVAGHVAGYVTGTVDSFVYDGGIPDVDPTRLTVGSVRPPNPAFTRTFEFRLSGSEESEQAFDLPKIDTQRAIVTRRTCACTSAAALRRRRIELSAGSRCGRSGAAAPWCAWRK